MVRGPRWVGEAHLDDARLDLGAASGAGRTPGASTALGQAGEADRGVAPQPAVHGLARDPVARGDLGDGQRRP